MMQRQRMKQRQPMPENRQAMCLWLRQVSTLMHQRRDLTQPKTHCLPILRHGLPLFHPLPLHHVFISSVPCVHLLCSMC